MLQYGYMSSRIFNELYKEKRGSMSMCVYKLTSFMSGNRWNVYRNINEVEDKKRSDFTKDV